MCYHSNRKETRTADVFHFSLINTSLSINSRAETFLGMSDKGFYVGKVSGRLDTFLMGALGDSFIYIGCSLSQSCVVVLSYIAIKNNKVDQ